MKIIRYINAKRGGRYVNAKRGGVGLHVKSYVVILDAGFCESIYFKLFRGYKAKVLDNSVLYKQIMSKSKFLDSRLSGVG